MNIIPQLNVNVGASSCTINHKFEVAEIYFSNNKCTVNFNGSSN